MWGSKKMKKIIAFLLCITLLGCGCLAEGTAGEGDWISFFLMCNEGMHNDGDNVGNTMMIVSMNPDDGQIKLMIMTWDTFIQYEGYDIPQLLDQPFRVAGPEETMRVFNQNFHMDLDNFLSVNYLGLANVIDAYGGVNVPVTRAERNALNGMVASKANQVLEAADNNLAVDFGLEVLKEEYYLQDYGENTHLNGLQAVGFGWLQYDSVYNCCNREIAVIQDLFSSVGKKAAEEVVFYDDTFGEPDVKDGRRKINLDHLTEDDINVIRRYVDPIFAWSYNNLTEDEIEGISIALISTAFEASRYGVSMFDRVEIEILPLEKLQEYDRVAGKQGHLINYLENEKAIKAFLYGEE